MKLGFLYMGLATCCLSLYYLFSKILLKQSTIQPYEITYWAGLSSTIVILTAMLIQEKRENSNYNIFSMPRAAIPSFLARGFFGFTSNLAGSFATGLLPLAQATVLYYMNPLFIGMLAYFYNERISLYDVGGIIVTFLGVFIFTMDPFSFSP